MGFHDAIINSLKSLGYALGSAASAGMALIEHSLPVIQWVGGIVAILAGVASIRASLATHDAIKKGKQ
jgi:hypothetical protein